MAIAFRAAASTPVSTQTTSLTVNKPTGVLDNDLLIAQIEWDNAGGAIISSAPAGWTLLDTITGNGDLGIAIYYKIAATEGASYTWNWSAAVRHGGSITAYSGCSTSSPIADHSIKRGTSSSITSTAVTVPSNGWFWAGFGDYNVATTYSTPPGLTNRVTNQNIVIFDSNGADPGSITAKTTITGTNFTNYAAAIALAPASVSTTLGWTHKTSVTASNHGGYSGGGTSAGTVTAAAPFAVGDLIVVVVSAGTTQSGANMTVLSVGDHLGNTYTSLRSLQYDAGGGGGTNTGTSGIWVSVCSHAGTPQITAAFNATASWGWCVGVDGFTGVGNVIDVSATPATGPRNTTPVSGTTPATTSGNELALAGYTDQGGSTANQAASGWSAGAQVSGTQDNNCLLMYKDSGATGSTISAGNPIAGGGQPSQTWAYLLVVLKLASLAAAEAAHAVDAGAVLALGGTTPGVGEAARGRDTASVITVGDPVLPPGWGKQHAPSWDVWRPSRHPYTFYAERLGSPGVSLGVLPLTNVSFGLRLNQPGQFKASLPLSDRRLTPDLDLIQSATEPEQAVIFIDRGGVIVGHASILTRRYDLATDSLELGGYDISWWLGRRVISVDQTFTAADPLSIARTLVAFTQGQPNGTLGLDLDASVLSGQTLDRTYNAVQGTQAAGSGTADSGNILTAITNLANLDAPLGFEFRAHARWDGSRIVRELLLAYPRFGVDAQHTLYWWSHPRGGIKTLVWPEDGTGTARKVYVLGTQASDNTRPVAISAVTPGYPLTEETLSYTADDGTSLQSIADSEQAAKASPQLIPEVTVYGPIEPTFGTYNVGDHARYSVAAGSTGRWLNGMDSVFRMVGLDVTVNSDGTEDVKHILAPAAT